MYVYNVSALRISNVNWSYERKWTQAKKQTKKNKTSSRLYPAESITEADYADYADDYTLFENTPVQVECPLRNLEKKSGGTGLYAISGKTEFMSFK